MPRRARCRSARRHLGQETRRARRQRALRRGISVHRKALLYDYLILIYMWLTLMLYTDMKYQISDRLVEVCCLTRRCLGRGVPAGGAAGGGGGGGPGQPHRAPLHQRVQPQGSGEHSKAVNEISQFSQYLRHLYITVSGLVTRCCVAARAAAHDEQRGHHGRAAGGRAPLRAAERGGARLEVGVTVVMMVV